MGARGTPPEVEERALNAMARAARRAGEITGGIANAPIRILEGARAAPPQGTPPDSPPEDAQPHETGTEDAPPHEAGTGEAASHEAGTGDSELEDSVPAPPTDPTPAGGMSGLPSMAAFEVPSDPPGIRAAPATALGASALPPAQGSTRPLGSTGSPAFVSRLTSTRPVTARRRWWLVAALGAIVAAELVAAVAMGLSGSRTGSGSAGTHAAAAGAPIRSSTAAGAADGQGRTGTGRPSAATTTPPTAATTTPTTASNAVAPATVSPNDVSSTPPTVSTTTAPSITAPAGSSGSSATSGLGSATSGLGSSSGLGLSLPLSGPLASLGLGSTSPFADSGTGP
jgi:hypothetical protein